MLHHIGFFFTFPHPGGPHKIRDGISQDSSRDRKRVCWPTILFWPKYSSSVLGLRISAKGFSIVRSVRGEIFCVVFTDERLFGVSVHGFPASASVGKLRLTPLMRPPEAAALSSLWTAPLLLLAWNRENTAGCCVPAIEEEPLTGLLTPGLGRPCSGLVVRDFFTGGPLSPAVSTLFSKHASRCPLIVADSKSLKQTGHWTRLGAADVISFAMLVPAKRGTLNHMTKHCFLI